ncbi:unnamed protein product [Onchocerca ochengi]|uniref:Homeobox protein 2-like n=1 Tax=Onchocerca ochengi TaxID=42157 RepID=A0A182EN43_ONCOC|nr:unnamed protein product [Onchocerca ochengi]
MITVSAGNMFYLSSNVLGGKMFTDCQGYSKKIFNLIGRGANEYARPENGYIRNSAEKPFKKCHKEVITAGRNPHNFQKPFVAKRSQSMIDLENECQKMGRILIQGSLTNMFPTSEGSQITTDRATNLGCVCRTESFKSFKMPTTEGVRQILSREEANLIDHLRTNNALKNSSNSNLKSLVSFDPKSNVLLRIHNHIDDDDDDDDNNGNDNDRNCHTDLIQRYLQQQQRISKQILSVGTAEQIQQQNLKCSSANNALANCQSNELTFDFTNMINNEYYGLTSFSKNCNHKSPNFLRQQPIYSKYGEDIMCDGTKQYIANKPSSIDHPKSQIISNIPIFNSSDFLV